VSYRTLGRGATAPKPRQPSISAAISRTGALP
jgi:hypothetical protein